MRYLFLFALLMAFALHGEELHGVDTWAGIKPHPAVVNPIGREASADLISLRGEWEFACRAGNGEGYWGDGSIYMSSTLPGRYVDNGGSEGMSDGSVGPEAGTAICGSYAPNSWGLYDMHGNVAELCIDWFQDVVPANIGANPNIDIANPAYCFDGTTTFTGSYRPKTKRGGSFAHGAYNARSAARNKDSVNTQYYNFGCRVICPFEK